MKDFDTVSSALVIIGLIGLGLLLVDLARPNSSSRWQLLGLCLAVQPGVAWLLLRVALIQDHRAALFVPRWLTDGEALVPHRGLQYDDWPLGSVLARYHLGLGFEVLAPAILVGVLVLMILRSFTLRRHTGGAARLDCEWPQLAVAVPALVAAVVIVWGTSLIDMAPRYLCCLDVCPPTWCSATAQATRIFQATATLIVFTPLVVIGAWLIARTLRPPNPDRARVRLIQRWPAFALLALGLGLYTLSAPYVGAQLEDSTCHEHEPAGFDSRLDRPINSTRSRVHLEDPSSLATPRYDAARRANPELELLEVLVTREGVPWIMHEDWMWPDWSSVRLDDFHHESDTGVLMFIADDDAPAWSIEQAFAGALKLHFDRVIVWAPCPRERVFPGFGLVRDEVTCEIGVIELGHEGEPLAGRSWPELTAALASAPGRVLSVHPPCRRMHGHN